MTQDQLPEHLLLAVAANRLTGLHAPISKFDCTRIAEEIVNLRAGYAAARLEIESLQARIKTMAEEHADELMVAHLDGRMRAAQPAPAQAIGPCVICGSDEPFTGTCGGGDSRALCKQPTPTPQADSVLEDAVRLDWLLLHISGAEFRRIGVHYSGNARRADVDAARKKGANHD